MFKRFLALVKGHGADALEATLDGNAIVILRQQIRESGDAITAAQRAVAVAIAGNDQEVRQCAAIESRLADLETRAVAALEKQRSDLAREAAETIALLEAERDASKRAQSTFSGEIVRLKGIVRDAEARLRELERGLRIASAAEKTHRLRETVPGSGLSTLRDAEETLARLNERQRQRDVAADAMAELALCGNPAALARKLAEAGCGAPINTSAELVLERLSAGLTTNA